MGRSIQAEPVSRQHFESCPPAPVGPGKQPHLLLEAGRLRPDGHRRRTRARRLIPDTPALRRLEASDVVLGDGVGRITDAPGAVPAGGAARPAADNNAAGSSTVTCYAVICTGLPRGPCNRMGIRAQHYAR